MPATQPVHEPLPATALKEPGLQGVASVEPVAQKEPVGHVVQLLASLSPAALANVPLAHGSAALAPAGQKAPAVQRLHCVILVPSWKVPLPQSVHAATLPTL